MQPAHLLTVTAVGFAPHSIILQLQTCQLYTCVQDVVDKEVYTEEDESAVATIHSENTAVDSVIAESKYDECPELNRWCYK